METVNEIDIEEHILRKFSFLAIPLPSLPSLPSLPVHGTCVYDDVADTSQST